MISAYENNKESRLAVQCLAETAAKEFVSEDQENPRFFIGYEHGQWWVEIETGNEWPDDVVNYVVVDTSNGFELEEL